MLHGICSMTTVHVVYFLVFFFLMIRRPPRSTQSRSSAASDVYKRQIQHSTMALRGSMPCPRGASFATSIDFPPEGASAPSRLLRRGLRVERHRRDMNATGISPVVTPVYPVSYTHLRAHETVLELVCRILLEKKNQILIHYS